MSQNVKDAALGTVDNLDELNHLLGPLSFRAGWNKHEPSLWPQPKANFKPARWLWADARLGLASAGRLIDTELAERRNLFLVNPLEGNFYSTVRTVVSAYQMILPGERARSHRHTPNALRLVLEASEDVYTVVDGQRLDMKPGDILLTPNWCWHGHANDGSAPAYWIDFLDVPLVQLLEPMFLEHWPDGFQQPTETPASSPMVFPWAEVAPKLDAASPDEAGRRRVQLGAPALPTMALHMERLSAGQRLGPIRTTANQIVAVVQGNGRSQIGGATFEWSRGDVMAVPCWNSFTHEATTDAVLFTVTDEPVQQKLGFLRSDAG